MRLAAASPSGDAGPDAPALEPALAAILDQLHELGSERGAIVEVLRQRLGDARTLGLLDVGETASGAGTLVALAARAAGGAVRRSLADNPDDVAGRLACVRDAIRFGRILLAQGVLAPRRLEAALASQKASGRRIGEELVAEGHISAREVAEALWLQHKLAACTLALILLPPREAAAPRLVHTK